MGDLASRPLVLDLEIRVLDSPVLVDRNLDAWNAFCINALPTIEARLVKAVPSAAKTPPPKTKPKAKAKKIPAQR